MSMRPSDLRLAGAVDLSALKQSASQPTGGGTASSSPYVVDVTEATFQAEVIERSRQVPVVIDFWAAWCGPCRQLSPVLERLAAEAAGAWVLVKIDVDANQRIAAAAGVQGIPAVKAVVNGAVVSEFTGALPEAQVRSWLTELVAFARGGGPQQPGAEPAEEDPVHAQADELVRRGDLEGAIALYRGVLERDPGDVMAKTAVAQLELLARLQSTDEQVARRRAAEAPDDLDAQLVVADLDMAHGRVEDALGRVTDLVRRSAGADRDRARTHLLGLFEVLDPDDPRLAAGRRALANALF